MERKEYMEKIFKNVAEKTLKRLDKDKGNHISRKSRKMIALTVNLLDRIR